MTDRPAFFAFPNGDPAPLPFAAAEYDARLAGLRASLAAEDLDAAVLTSMQGIAYYCGFLYCSFGRPYALVVTPRRLDAGRGQHRRRPAAPPRPWRGADLHRLGPRQLLARGPAR